MSDTLSNVQTELATHVEILDELIKTVQAKQFADGDQKAVSRFIRDCETLKTDVASDTNPTTGDLVDYHNRRAVLEVQAFNYTKDDD